VASAGTFRVSGLDPAVVEGQHQRVPIGVRKIGLIARTRRPLVAPSLRGTEAWIADRDWVTAEGVRSFAGFPLVDGGTVHGVVAVFDRRHLDDRMLAERAQLAADLGPALRIVSKLAEPRNGRWLPLEDASTPDLAAAGSAWPVLAGDGPVHRRITAQIELAAASTAPVLVVGARGTGRTATAEAIHARGPRAGRSLVRVSLSAPADDLEAALFGARGDAVETTRIAGAGLLARAEGTTLLLDDLHRLPPALTEPVADWLEHHATHPEPARAVRVVATATPDASAEDGGVVRLLLHRLVVVRIDLPPLRERIEDVASMVRFLVKRLANQAGRDAPALTPAALGWLRSYSWPGNVAELRAVLDRAVRICGEALTPEALEFRPPFDDAGSVGETTILTRAQLRQRERESIRAALGVAGGRVSGPGGAADLLGVKPTTLASRIKALGLTSVARRRHRSGRT
jgi:DNA-binding NtrC family response regulator